MEENMKIVVALGGNALGKTAKEQLKLVSETAKPLVDLIEDGHEIVIVHGNGPQVGMINLAMEEANNNMPFPECGAMSQGYIGFHLQSAIQAELKSKRIMKSVATIVTQVIVSETDPAFQNPTKPIGKFYKEQEVPALEEKGYIMVEDSGRGYRRVVPSPLPVDIEEKEMIFTLINSGNVVITCGGGGIPVVRDGFSLKGVPAVIDKDNAAMLLAKMVDADYLVVLTAVEKVAINFGKENEKWLSELSVEEAKEYIEEGHFAPGSMLPKVEACIKFAESLPERKALITSLEKAKEGLNGLTGTIIK
ncbi:carbamate kinase [Mycoplasmatota bacterium]|nr:carbamate kinase [Mycoplasmatota bacterium]